jgi:hypothetical protein
VKMEIWKDIEGYEGKYQVSSCGRVKSLNYNKTGREQILEPIKFSNGYLLVCLYKNGKGKYKLIHRLVAEAFIPNPKNLPYVNHKDENKENNRVDNLEWCEQKYNLNYGTRNERISKKLLNREDLSKPVLCVETGIVYSSAMEAERQTGADNGHIIACCKGKKYKTTKGYHWQYAD